MDYPLNVFVRKYSILDGHLLVCTKNFLFRFNRDRGTANKTRIYNIKPSMCPDRLIESVNEASEKGEHDPL